jgi:hypothetical protein
MDLLEWIILALLIVDMIGMVILWVDNRRCVREAETEVQLAETIREKCFSYLTAMDEMHKVMMGVINGEDASIEAGTPATGSADSSSPDTAWMASRTDELPRLDESEQASDAPGGAVDADHR